MNFYLRFITPFSLFLSIVVSHDLQVRSTSNVNFTAILKPVLNFLDCKQQSAEVQLLCSLVAQKIHPSLISARITAEPSSNLFTYTDPVNKRIAGDSCWSTTEITSLDANAALLSSVALNFTAKPFNLSEPFVFGAEAPVELWARASVRQRFGVRVPWVGCRRYYSDTSHVTGTIDTTARLVIFFTVVPSLRTDAAGSLVLTITPITQVASQLANMDFEFKATGIFWFSAFLTAITSPMSALQNAITSFLNGDILRAVWTLIFQPVGSVIAGELLLIPNGLIGDLIEPLLESWVKSKVQRASTTYTGVLEQTLRAKVAQTLHLDANGSRRFVAKKNYADLVRQFGNDADIWVSVSPARRMVGM